MSIHFSTYTEKVFNDLQKISDEYIRNSNSEFNELTKQIALFASILLPLVGLFFTSETFLNEADSAIKILAYAAY